MAPKILVILTSHSKLGSTGKPTGWYLPELAHPYDVLTAAGAQLTVASPLGGEAPLDPASIELFKNDASSAAFLADKKAVWASTAKLADVSAADYDAVFIPGGHGPLYDLATDETSRRLIAEFAAAGKVVASVCHGPAALVNVTLPGGKHLLEGKKVTGFSNVEEEQVGLTKVVPFLLEDALKKAGGAYEKAAEPWAEKVVVDGKLITGQNPASSKAVGEAIVKLLG